MGAEGFNVCKAGPTPGIDIAQPETSVLLRSKAWMPAKRPSEERHEQTCGVHRPSCPRLFAIVAPSLSLPARLPLSSFTATRWKCRRVQPGFACHVGIFGPRTPRGRLRRNRTVAAGMSMCKSMCSCACKHTHTLARSDTC